MRGTMFLEGFAVCEIIVMTLAVILKGIFFPAMPWWVVFAPLWLPVTFAILMLCVLGIASVIFARHRDKADSADDGIC